MSKRSQFGQRNVMRATALVSGGRVTLSITADLLTMSVSDRQFVTELIDIFRSPSPEPSLMSENTA